MVLNQNTLEMTMGHVLPEPFQPTFSFWEVNGSGHNQLMPVRNAGCWGASRGGGDHPVGDATAGQVRLSFNSRLRVEFRRATVTSDAGLLIGVVVIRLFAPARLYRLVRMTRALA